MNADTADPLAVVAIIAGLGMMIIALAWWYTGGPD